MKLVGIADDICFVLCNFHDLFFHIHTFLAIKKTKVIKKTLHFFVENLHLNSFSIFNSTICSFSAEMLQFYGTKHFPTMNKRDEIIELPQLLD